ncbi:uncharacterized protein HHUB_2201 [Halobacterium hubeiense]|uniref:Uncharacterized protein n=1 Tax=Halobacterium hubeiense TaxID=1407499 RepID=A0A0U5HTL1_9EURY|nr:hypothetical protein [Halobacterium hubeiense]CQH55221.1 uncharacterized protein HHUB_2201 [Halobacterium hubeiense]
MSDEITFRSSELLLLQNLMDGQNTGIDYGGFDDVRINTARYRGNRGEHLYQSEVLNPAQDGGRVIQIRFHVSYTGDVKDKRVQIRAYEDGHISTSEVPTGTDLLDWVEETVTTVLDNREYLDSLELLLRDWVFKEFGGRSMEDPRSVAERIEDSFENMVSNYFDEEDYQDEEIKIFESLISNIGIKLSQLDLDSSQYPDPPADQSRPTPEGRVKMFFEKYAKWDDEMTSVDFDILWNHLVYLMSGDYDSPIEIIETAEREYAL